MNSIFLGSLPLIINFQLGSSSTNLLIKFRALSNLFLCGIIPIIPMVLLFRMEVYPGINALHLHSWESQ